jgi:hypothetical protein
MTSHGNRLVMTFNLHGIEWVMVLIQEGSWFSYDMRHDRAAGVCWICMACIGIMAAVLSYNVPAGMFCGNENGIASATMECSRNTVGTGSRI